MKEYNVIFFKYFFQGSTCLLRLLDVMLVQGHGYTVSISDLPRPHAYLSGTSCMEQVRKG